MRIGQALGLRHEDVVAWERRILIFLTDGSFRAVHQQHHDETRRLLEKARKNHNVRLIEVLERDEQSLARIIEGLDAVEADHADGDALDLRDLAWGEQEGA
jgi:hypothetical protein